MRPSSDKFEVGLEGLSGLQDGPKDVDAAAGEGDERLVVAFALVALACVEGPLSGAGREQKAAW
jgi:hypothetical protein